MQIEHRCIRNEWDAQENKNLALGRTVMKKVLLLVLMSANLCGAIVFAAPASMNDDGLFSLATIVTETYGPANTTDLLSTIPATGEYGTGHLMIKVAIPYQFSNLDSVAPGIENLRPSEAARKVKSGLGDTFAAAASYNIYSGSASTFGVDLTGKVKLNTAAADLGNSLNDYAAQADAYQSFSKFTALGSLGLKVMPSSTGISMNRELYGSFGGSYQLDDNMNGGIDIKLSQNPYAMGEGHRELSAYVSHKINKNFKAKGYVLKGFSNGSPDSSLGAQVYYGF
jgi:hypothetical protein